MLVSKVSVYSIPDTKACQRISKGKKDGKKKKKKQLKKVRKRTDRNKENIFYSFWTGVKCSTDSKRMQFRLKLQTPALI